MERIKIVLHRDFKELRKTNAFLLICIMFAAITVAASLIIIFTLRRQVLLGNELSKPVLEIMISIIAYFLPLFIILTFIWAFSNLTIIQEKVRGNIESLLATPLSPKEIWIGKSMAIFIPGYIISVISTVAVLLSVNFIAILPSTGNFILPALLILISLFFNPLLFMALLLFTVLFSLANNPDIAITPSFLVGFGLMIGIPLGVATGAINLASWEFAFWCLGGALIFWALNFGFYYLLTKEKIVLSSKGEQ